jgi:hypothetical protein
VVIWYIFHRFGILYQEESGNPGSSHKKVLEAGSEIDVLTIGDAELKETFHTIDSPRKKCRDKLGNWVQTHRQYKKGPKTLYI